MNPMQSPNTGVGGKDHGHREEPQGFLCGARIYQYNGWTFEYGPSGPWPHKDDGELRKRCGRVFLKAISGWLAMSHKQRQDYRAGGGCRSL